MLEAAQKSPDAAGRLGDLVNWDVKAFDVTERLGQVHQGTCRLTGC